MCTFMTDQTYLISKTCKSVNNMTCNYRDTNGVMRSSRPVATPRSVNHNKLTQYLPAYHRLRIKDDLQSSHGYVHYCPGSRAERAINYAMAGKGLDTWSTGMDRHPLGTPEPFLK